MFKCFCVFLGCLCVVGLVVLGGTLVVLILLCIAYLEDCACWVSWVVWGKVIVGPHRWESPLMERGGKKG